MPELWTEIIDPVTLTGYTRASLEAYEERTGSLRRYLPNTTVDDITVKFEIGPNGLNEAARFRAWDAEPERARDIGGKSVILELPALGLKQHVSEYRQLRLRNASDTSIESHILKTTDKIVKSVADLMEHMRGVVLDTGRATITQENFRLDDNFGRPSAHTITAPTLWSTVTVSRISQLKLWFDLYVDTNNGEAPGSMLMSTRAYSALVAGDEFLSPVTGRPMTRGEVGNIFVDAGLPPIDIYDRKVRLYGAANSTRTTADDIVLFLPAPGQGENGLGATYWGKTLTSTELGWGIEDDEQAGIVAGVTRTQSVPTIAEVVTDAIGMPVLGNAALSLRAKVL